MSQSSYTDKPRYYDCLIDSDKDEFWPEEDIATEIWAQLRIARMPFRASIDNHGEDNPWVKFVKPGKYLPECGFRVYVPGRIKRRKEFAQFVVGVMGKHFRISCWVRKRGGQTLFDTEDAGLNEDFFANLKVTVEKLTEIAVQVDEWSRAGTLKESFPEEWVGMARLQVIKSLHKQWKQSK